MRIPPAMLATGVSGRRLANWRALTGADELALHDCDYAAAVGWIANMMLGGEGVITSDDIIDLTIADGDRLFAALYRALFGPNLEMRQSCSACSEPFELMIALDDLTAAHEAAPAEHILAGGTRLRPLRLRDLFAARAGATLQGLIDAAVEQRGDDSSEAIAAAVEMLTAATIETIETDCAHCGARQVLAFDLSRFLLDSLARERPILLREVHLLAQTYGWSFGEIMGLDRATRHGFVRLATARIPARRRMQAL